MEITLDLHELFCVGCFLFGYLFGRFVKTTFVPFIKKTIQKLTDRHD